MLDLFFITIFLCFTVGCGAFSKDSSPGRILVSKSHQSQSTIPLESYVTWIESWSGSYEGQGNIRFSGSDYWQKDRQIQLVIQAVPHERGFTPSG